jgi:hypothetical protein
MPAPAPVTVHYEYGMSPQDSANEFVEKLTRMGQRCGGCGSEFVNIVGAGVTEVWETEVYYYDRRDGRPLHEPKQAVGRRHFYHKNCVPDFDIFNVWLTPDLGKTIRLPSGQRFRSVG